MPALELLTFFATAPGTNLTAGTAATGNTATVRNAPENEQPRILQVWGDLQAGGIIRVRSPRLHDNVQGIRLTQTSSELEPLLPFGVDVPVFPQDTLTIEIAGSNTAGDIESVCMLMYYPTLPGINGRFISPEELRTRRRHIATVENTLALTTAGGYSGEEAINAEQDHLKANTDYAIVGALVSAECAAIGWRGSETGNLRIGMPGMVESKGLTARWFIMLSEWYNLPLIPVFNSANKQAFLIDGVQDENGADVTVTTILAELND